MLSYTTRELLQALELRKPLRTLFCNFFPTSNTHIAEILEFDVKKGKRVMAPFVAPRKGGKIIKREGFNTKTLRTPRIAPERILTIDDIDKRGFGENIYSNKTPEQRSNELFAKDMTDLEETIQRRKEWMARQIILEGKIDVQDVEEGVDIQIDFGFTNTETLAGGAKWDTDTSKPLEDLKRWRRAVIKQTGKAPTICIMGTKAFDQFMANKAIQRAFDLKNFLVGKIEPRVVDPSLTYGGRLTELDLDIYSYDEWFIDDDGVEKPMLPENKILLLPDEIGSFEYGAVTQMESGQFVTYAAEVVPKTWNDEKNEVKMLRMTSRPIPKPIDVDSWYVATVV